MKAVGTALVVLLLAGPARAADLPRPVLPEGVGVNIHFVRGHGQDLDRMAAAGFKVVRTDFAWPATGRKKGAYDWSAYDELTANLGKRGLRPLYILDYTNLLYEGAVVSRDPASGRPRRDVVSPQHMGHLCPDLKIDVSCDDQDERVPDVGEATTVSPGSARAGASTSR